MNLFFISSNKLFPYLINFLILLFVLSTSQSIQIRCVKKERQALLSFKEGLQDDYGLLSSWHATDDCCEWNGVRCSNRTSHVIALDLPWVGDPHSEDSERLAYSEDSERLRGKLGPSLLELQHLTYLDLSLFDSSGSLVPKFIGSLRRLKYLNLSHCEFSGIIPVQLGNLSNLQYLDLHGENFDLAVENLKWLSHLSSLRYLDLSGVYLNDAYDWPEAVNSLPFLTELRLSTCRLPSIPNSFNFSTSLSLLDLSFNFDIELSKFIGSFRRLKYLYLAGCSLVGVSHLGNLSNLQHLDLSGDPVAQPLAVKDLNWLSHLSSLRYLDLSWINLSTAYDWPKAVNSLPFLTELRLSGCGLPTITPTSFPLFNFSMSLSILDLSKNDLDIEISRFQWLSNISSLTDINLEVNGLFGIIPIDFGKLQSLEHLDMSSNMLEGGITNSVGNLSSCLRSLDLSSNRLNGTIPPSLWKLPTLESLRLSANQFEGVLPNFMPPSPLSELDLSQNRFSGTIPPSMGNLTELNYLDLSVNGFSGTISPSMGNLTELNYLDFSSNSFIGLVSEVHLQNLSKLHGLHFSDNALTLKFNSNWVPPFNLTSIGLANCKIGPHFPSWLQSQKRLYFMHVSGSGIHDAIPSWFGDLSSKISYLNMSNNQIQGILPDFSFGPLIDLSSNNIEGPIPELPTNIEFLSLSKNKFQGSILSLCNRNISPFFVDLSDNLLSGRLPDCLMQFKELIYLNLENNNFSGSIPSSIGLLTQIRSLHLRNNSLDGELPKSLKQCKELRVIDVGHNKLSGRLPRWLGRNLQNLIILSLQSNQFDGTIPSNICYLEMLQILDLSKNNISGTIPNCLTNLTAMLQKGSSHSRITFVDSFAGMGHSGFGLVEEVTSLVWKGIESEYRNTLGLVKSIDLSSNNLTGEIPSQITHLEGLVALNISRNNLHGQIALEIGHLQLLEFLDLSRNQLSGQIPMSLSQLHFIGVLDLSSNNLSGRIPSSTQLQSFDASSYSGNLGLCGRPLPNLCPEDQRNFAPRRNPDSQSEDEERLIGPSFYIALGIGFAVGLWGTLGSLLVNNSWRIGYFKLVADIQDSLYVTVVVNAIKMKRLLKK